MSRIGKLPVALPPGVSVKWESPVLQIKGPKGELAVEVKDPAGIEMEGNVLHVTRPDDERLAKSRQGLYRALINSAVHGVFQGYERKLEVIGVGYKAEVTGKILKLTLGFAFPKEFPIPEGINIKVEKDTITVSGINRQQVGDVSARIRRHRPPEPYKGKGIRYQGEYIRRKAGKAAAGGKK